MATEVIDQFRDASNQQLVNAGDSTNTAVRVNVVQTVGGSSSGTSTVVQGTASNLNATVVGTVAVTESGAWTVTVTQATGTNLHAVVDSGTITTVPSGTQSTTLIGTETVVGTVSVSGGTSTATLSGTVPVSISTPNLDLQLNAALPTRDNDLIGRLDQLVTLQQQLLDYQVQLWDTIRPVGQVGPKAYSDGQGGFLRQGKSGGLVTLNAHAPYQEAVIRGNIFTGANANAVTLAAGTAAVGLIVYNPSNSGKNLVFIRALTSPSGAVTGTLNVCNIYTSTSIVGAPTGTTTDIFVSNLIGVPTNSVALVYSTATFAQTPTLLANVVKAWLPNNIVLGTATATGTALNQVGGIYFPQIQALEGLYVMTPGNYALIGFNGGGNCGLTWEEIPI